METDKRAEIDADVSRRDFLKKAGFGVAGLAATSAILAACTDGDDDTAGTTTTALFLVIALFAIRRLS